MFFISLFTLAKVWKYSVCTLTDEWIKNVVRVYNWILLCLKKEENSAKICNMDELRGHHAEGNKPSQENKYFIIALIYDI
jgi:hypothetical protein